VAAAERAVKERFQEEWQASLVAQVAAAADAARAEVPPKSRPPRARPCTGSDPHSLPPFSTQARARFEEEKAVLEAARDLAARKADAVAMERDRVELALVAAEAATKRLEYTSEVERDALRQELEREQAAARRAASEAREVAAQEVEARMRDEADLALERAEENFRAVLAKQREKDERFMNERLDKAARDGLAAVAQLEGEIDVLVREKGTVEAALAASQQALQDAQRSHEEHVQATADKFKDFSLNAWRMTVRMRTIQEVFATQAQAKIAKFEKEQAALRENLQTGYVSTAVALLRVGQVVLQYEEARRRTDEALRTYKQDELAAKKKALKGCVESASHDLYHSLSRLSSPRGVYVALRCGQVGRGHRPLGGQQGRLRGAARRRRGAWRRDLPRARPALCRSPPSLFPCPWCLPNALIGRRRSSSWTSKCGAWRKTSARTTCCPPCSTAASTSCTRARCDRRSRAVTYVPGEALTPILPYVQKRRLDAELERLLESIQQKRTTIAELDECIGNVDRERDAREAEMVDVEKELVKILVEQQKSIVGFVGHLDGAMQRTKELVMQVRLRALRINFRSLSVLTHSLLLAVIIAPSRQDAQLPWPPPEKPENVTDEAVMKAFQKVNWKARQRDNATALL
jgi:hypothetical protein